VIEPTTPPHCVQYKLEIVIRSETCRSTVLVDADGIDMCAADSSQLEMLESTTSYAPARAIAARGRTWECLSSSGGASGSNELVMVAHRHRHRVAGVHHRHRHRL